jgi:hypothetical protein
MEQNLGDRIEQAKGLTPNFNETVFALRFGNKELVVNF